MKKIIILRKIHVTMKYLICSIILQSFQFEPEHKKKTCGKSHEKEVKPIHTWTADSLHIRIGSFD